MSVTLAAKKASALTTNIYGLLVFWAPYRLRTRRKTGSSSLAYEY
jgi:hypothetical protein